MIENGYFRSDKFLLFVEDELLNPTLFIFVKIFLMNAKEINHILSINMTMNEFLDAHTLDRDKDVRTFLNTRLQLLLRALNRSSLNRADAIDTLLITEHDFLAKALAKLELPF